MDLMDHFSCNNLDANFLRRLTSARVSFRQGERSEPPHVGCYEGRLFGIVRMLEWQVR
jgi:hypothetical protein